MNKYLSNLIACIFVCVCSASAWAAPAIENSVKGYNSGGADPVITVSLTVTAATCLYAGTYTSDTMNLPTVTYNGSSLTQIDTVTYAGIGGSLTIFAMVSPPTGTHNILVNGISDLGKEVDIVAFGVTECESSSIAASHRTIYNSSNGGAGPSVTVVDSQSGDLVVDWAIAIASLTVGAGQTQIQQEADGGTFFLGSSYEAATGANTVMSWTEGVGINRQTAFAVVPGSGGGGSTSGGMLLLMQ